MTAIAVLPLAGLAVATVVAAYLQTPAGKKALGDTARAAADSLDAISQDIDAVLAPGQTNPVGMCEIPKAGDTTRALPDVLAVPDIVDEKIRRANEACKRAIVEFDDAINTPRPPGRRDGFKGVRQRLCEMVHGEGFKTLKDELGHLQQLNGAMLRAKKALRKVQSIPRCALPPHLQRDAETFLGGHPDLTGANVGAYNPMAGVIKKFDSNYKASCFQTAIEEAAKSKAALAALGII